MHYISQKYNPKYGDHKICKCGHIYHNHFYSWVGIELVVCQECYCCTFEESTDLKYIIKKTLEKNEI